MVGLILGSLPNKVLTRSKEKRDTMVAMNITAALGTSIMAFFLGVLIGFSLGYVRWAEKNLPKGERGRKRVDNPLILLKKKSLTEQQRRGDDESK